MSAVQDFRAALQEAVNYRHQANHPLVAKWANGEVKRQVIAGAITEHWHWISNLVPAAMLGIAAKGPPDVVDMELENVSEELDPKNPHPALILRFAKACGIDADTLRRGRGLPTTESWLSWEMRLIRDEPWIASVAGVHIASEAQEPKLFSKILPALRNVYKFSEHDLEYWWLHAEADVEHGGRAFEILMRHCDTSEKKEMALHWAKEGARMKYFFWDGINLAYDMGYQLQ